MVCLSSGGALAFVVAKGGTDVGVYKFFSATDGWCYENNYNIHISIYH
ncbi:MAG: hypothetical protein M3264_11225 [Thermoproteota archaeon]|nr:hypothetical protein [Thermoproteota archaeon]